MNLSRLETFNREKRAIWEGIKELGAVTGLMLTSDDKRSEEIEGHMINIMPVWEWLLVNEV